MYQRQDPATPAFRFLQVESRREEVMVPHESGIPVAVRGRDGKVGLERVGDVVRVSA
jgi:hypothetical protein